MSIDLNELLPIKRMKYDTNSITQSNNNNNNNSTELLPLTVEQQNEIRTQWEERNYNDFNSWMQKTKSNLIVNTFETIKSTQFKTILSLSNTSGLFKDIINSEGEASSKKKSKTNAMRSLLNILLNRNLILYEPKCFITKDITTLSIEDKLKRQIASISYVNDTNYNQCVDSLKELIAMSHQVENFKLKWNDIACMWYYTLLKGDYFNIKQFIETLYTNNNDNVNIIDTQIKDEMPFSLVFACTVIQQWNTLKNIMNVLYENISYENDSTINRNCCCYYKHFKKLYYFELLEPLYIQIEQMILDPNLSLINQIASYGYIEQHGSRFSQEIVKFIPEYNEECIVKTSSGKDNVISEDELVLLEINDKKYVGYVSEVDNNKHIAKVRKCLSYDDNPCNNNGKYKMTKLMNVTVYNKTLQGLKTFCANNTSDVDVYIKDIITSTYESTQPFEYIEQLCNEIIYDLPNDFVISNQLLNESQKEAIIASLTQRLTIIQGPPGTGKTSTCIEIVLEWLRLHRYSYNDKILLTAESNCAVDILMNELQIANIPSYRYSYKDNICYDYSSIKDKIETSRVICCTCVGTTNDYLKSYTFPFIIIDESTQATELSTILPLLRGCHQLTLIGDHKQLPPTILSPIACNDGLNISLFERLINFGLRPKLLNKQYRMHSSLYTFPSQTFYNDCILNGVPDNERPLIKGIQWPNCNVHVGFVDINGKEEMEMRTHSYYNVMEVNYVVEVLNKVISEKGNDEVSIGVITPYGAQKKEIWNGVKMCYENLGKEVLTVDTVDGFQGMEKDLIIFSFVRSNESGKIGFVNDLRRINVILTRAKRGLVVIGNRRNMEKSDIWRKWLKFVDDNGLYIKQ